MADFSFSNMPWLIPQGSPADYLAKGVNAGSQIASNINQSRQTSVSAQALALQAQREQRMMEERAQTLPLELASKKQEIEMRSLSLQAEWQSKQELLDASKEFTNLTTIWTDKAKAGELSPTDVPLGMASVMSRYPHAMDTPAGRAFIGVGDSIMKAQEYANNLKQRAEMAEAERANKLQMEREKSDSARMAKEAATPVFEKKYNFLKQGMESELKRPLTPEEDIKLREKASTTQGASITREMPDGTTEVIRFGGDEPITKTRPDFPAQSTIAFAQRKLPELEMANQNGAKLSKLITPETTGVKGMINQGINVLSAQTAGLTSQPEIANLFRNKAVVDYQTLAGIYQNQFKKAISPDSNPSDRFLKELDKLTPSPISATEDAESAFNKLQMTRALVVTYGRKLAERSKQPISMMWKTPTELTEMFRNRAINPDTGKEITLKDLETYAENSPYWIREKGKLKQFDPGEFLQGLP